MASQVNQNKNFSFFANRHVQVKTHSNPIQSVHLSPGHSKLDLNDRFYVSIS